MNSFDVFDTLLARRFVDSSRIFSMLEKEFGIACFASRRLAADNGQRDIAGIYDHLGLDPAIMHREIELEIEQTVPVQENLRQVRHGDLLISDTYLGPENVERMLRAAGLTQTVSLLVSNDGKRSGRIWSALASKPPDLHLGDNAVSDLDVPRRHGIECELYPGTCLTAVETEIAENGFACLSFLVREARLRSVCLTGHAIQDLSGQYNLPLLFVLAETLSRRHSGPLVFLGRDCQLLHRLYSAYYAPSAYKPFSRLVAYGQPEEAFAYLQSGIDPGSTFVDLVSTGATWQKIGGRIDVDVAVYSDSYHYTPDPPSLPSGFQYVARSSEVALSFLFEVLNCGDHGHLSAITKLTSGDHFVLKFARPEMNPAVVSDIHAPILQAIELVDYYKDDLRKELAAANNDTLMMMLATFLAAIGRSDSLRAGLESKDAYEAAYLAKIRSLPSR